MKDQSALGGRTVNRAPAYNHLQMARVTSTKDFNKFGKIEAIFLDYSQPVPIWVINDLDREPVSGDFILVGFMEGRKDMPYMVGFVKNKNYTTNFMVIKKDKIKLQLPVFDIGVKDGKAHKDTQDHLLDNTKQAERAYIELTPDAALIQFPTSKTGATAPASIKITATEVIISHPGTIKHNTGSKGIARLGDSVSVVVGGTSYTGTITSASTKSKID